MEKQEKVNNYYCTCGHCEEIRRQQIRHQEWLTSLPADNKKYVQIK